MRLRKLQRFLKSEVPYKQALLLLAIYEVIVCRALVKTQGTQAFTESGVSLTKDRVKFDLRTFAHLQAEYDSFPQEVKAILDPYVAQATHSWWRSLWNRLLGVVPEYL